MLGLVSTLLMRAVKLAVTGGKMLMRFDLRDRPKDLM